MYVKYFTERTLTVVIAKKTKKQKKLILVYDFIIVDFKELSVLFKIKLLYTFVDKT